jgi:hypothetical protein
MKVVIFTLNVYLDSLIGPYFIKYSFLDQLFHDHCKQSCVLATHVLPDVDLLSGIVHIMDFYSCENLECGVQYSGTHSSLRVPASAAYTTQAYVFCWEWSILILQKFAFPGLFS